jgi:hypothetical protein
MRPRSQQWSRVSIEPVMTGAILRVPGDDMQVDF